MRRPTTANRNLMSDECDHSQHPEVCNLRKPMMKAEADETMRQLLPTKTPR